MTHAHGDRLPGGQVLADNDRGCALNDDAGRSLARRGPPPRHYPDRLDSRVSMLDQHGGLPSEVKPDITLEVAGVTDRSTVYPEAGVSHLDARLGCGGAGLYILHRNLAEDHIMGEHKRRGE